MSFLKALIRPFQKTPPPKKEIGWQEPRYEVKRITPEELAGLNPTQRFMLEIGNAIIRQADDRLERVYEDGPPPSLDDFPHKKSSVPENAKLKAWAKLKETERWMTMTGWAMWRTEPILGINRVLAEDMVSGFFYAFEATVQVLKEEAQSIKGKNWFDPWLKSHSRNSLKLRGLRTVRSLAVHIEDIRTSSDFSVSSVLGKPSTVSRVWRLPRITKENFDALTSPKVTVDELPAWAEVCGKHHAGTIMNDGFDDLRQVLVDAEAALK